MAEIRQWLESRLGETPVLVELPGDASFRKYYRIKIPGKSLMLMDAPVGVENAKQFVFVTKLLQRSGLRIPAIEHADLDHGLLLLEDLGDQLLLNCLNKSNARNFYQLAIEDLLVIQHSDTDGLLRYCREKLGEEVNIFKDWLCEEYLGCCFSDAEKNVFENTKEMLIQHALSQPQVFVHGDYQSRNIMVVPDGLAHIDYQDASLGPFCYDLVSLLRDCYVKWPGTFIEGWIAQFLSLRKAAGCTHGFTKEQFRRWFDFMGLQRHLKASGIFCRLLKRDGKPGYIKDVPRVFDYMLDCCEQYPELYAFGSLLKKLRGRFIAAVASD